MGSPGATWSFPIIHLLVTTMKNGWCFISIIYPHWKISGLWWLEHEFIFSTYRESSSQLTFIFFQRGKYTTKKLCNLRNSHRISKVFRISEIRIKWLKSPFFLEHIFSILFNYVSLFHPPVARRPHPSRRESGTFSLPFRGGQFGKKNWVVVSIGFHRIFRNHRIFHRIP